MKKGKTIDSLNGEITLPEAMIHHIQSFMNWKEAARSTILSKSWYNAWLTRPFLQFDDLDFYNCSRKLDEFEKYAAKRVKRYQDLRLKIECFRLLRHRYSRMDVTHNLIVSVMKIGATDVELVLPSFTLPQEVLGSETLVRLHLSRCDVNWNHISCSSLKSLSLISVKVRSDDEFTKIISCCNLLEELTLNHCYGLAISRKNLYELHKLRRLFLYMLVVDNMFFTDFEFRFPCLEDLSIHHCNGSTNIQIASTSLQTISFKPVRGSWKAKFDVPNIRKFTYSAFGLPHFSINGALREWEFDISIPCKSSLKPSWFLNLKKLLTKFRLSRVSLSIILRLSGLRGRFDYEHEVDIEVVPNPLVVENLMINVPFSICCALLVRLFGICRPKFITHYWLSHKCHGSLYGRNETLDILWKRLMQQLITPNCGIPDQNMFGQFGLKKVNVEVYEMFGTEWQPEWQPLLLKQLIAPNCGIPDQDMFGPFELKKVKVEVYEMIYTEWWPLLLKEPLDVPKTLINKRKIWFELIWED